MNSLRTRSYDRHFYSSLATGTSTSAAVIVPWVMELLKPKSVVDIGCGEGIWLAEFYRHGLRDILGIDGAYVNTDRLAIPKDCYLAHDLRAPLPNLSKNFDLALCLEVAEHLEAQFADPLVSQLTRLAPACLFSAAIPHQGGTHHVNEQWQDYWAAKFVAHGFKVFDPIRLTFWGNENVSYVYRQNAMLYVSEKACDRFSSIQPFAHRTSLANLACVHPHKWLKNFRRPSLLRRVLNLAVRPLSGLRSGSIRQRAPKQ